MWDKSQRNSAAFFPLCSFFLKLKQGKQKNIPALSYFTKIFSVFKEMSKTISFYVSQG